MKMETLQQTPKKLQRIIRTCFKSLYSTKLENLNKIDDFLDRYHLPNLNQDQVIYLNNSISSNEIEAILKLFHKIETERTLPNSFYEATFPLIHKPNNDSTKKEYFRLISLKNIDPKILNKILATQKTETHSRHYPPRSHRLYLRDAGMIQYMKIHQHNPPYKQIEI